MRFSNLIASIVISVLIISGCSQQTQTTQNGWIALRVKDPTSATESEIIVMNGEGEEITFIGHFSGSPTWSHDGRYLAVGCEDHVCILDIDTLPEFRKIVEFNGMMDRSPQTVAELNAPYNCKEKYEYGAGGMYSGILSMTWSPDDQELAVVCGSEEPNGKREICILSLHGERECWPAESNQDIYRLSWSPSDPDLLLASGIYFAGNPSQIFTVDKNGHNRKYLADGWSAVWSPGGSMIAYLNATEEHLGIWYMDKNGNPLPHQKEKVENMMDYNCAGFTGTCKLAWSPDEKYLIFVSPMIGYELHLFRIDRKTGEIIQIMDDRVISYPAEPDWGLANQREYTK